MNKSKTALLYLSPLIAAVLFNGIKFETVQALMGFSLAILVGFAFLCSFKKKMTCEKAVTMLVILGAILRIGYTLYTYFTTRSYDIGYISDDGIGHYGYILNIFNGHLPETNLYQFYHPPLYYIISAVFVKIGTIFYDGAKNFKDCMFLAQSVSCIASVITLDSSVKLMKELKMSAKAQIPAVLLIAVYPTHILMSGRVNNDSLVLMFMVLSIYYTVKWFNNRSLSNILKIAFSIGFGMMTKLNCGTVALFTGPIMLYCLIKEIKNKNRKGIKELIIQFAAFAVVCFPLGLWYPIRNLILFDQPLSFVLKLEDNHFLYRGNLSFVKRFITFPLSELFTSPYADMKNDYNVIMMLIKTGVHGEFSYDFISESIAGILNFLHLFILIISLAAICITLFKAKKPNNMAKYGSVALWAITAVSYVSFNISHPHICTADFRYVVLGQITAAIMTGFAMEYLDDKRNNKLCRYTFNVFSAIIFSFSVFCILHFC